MNRSLTLRAGVATLQAMRSMQDERSGYDAALEILAIVQRRSRFERLR